MTGAPVSPTEPLERLIAYFGELGPRWGLHADTCRAHALLFLTAASLDEAAIADALGLSAEETSIAMRDLAHWRMSEREADGRWSCSGDPWKLLFTAMEERRRREVQPALDVLRECHRDLSADAHAPRVSAQRTGQLLRLVEDLAVIDLQASRLSPATLSRVAALGGTLARLVGRIAPPTKGSTRD